MRVMSKIVVAFGLVTIPARVYRATESVPPLQLHLIHGGECGARIQMRPYCAREESIVERSALMRAVEVARDTYLRLSESELDDLPLPTKRVLELVQFTDTAAARDITRHAHQTYYLEPEPTAKRAYALLRDTLAENGLLALGKLTLRERERVVAVEPAGPVLLATTLSWPDEVRGIDDLDLPEVGSATGRERHVAEQLIRALRGSYEPAAFRDEHRAALEQLVAAKVNGHGVRAGASETPTRAVVDLMAALEASVAEARRRRRTTRARGAA